MTPEQKNPEHPAPPPGFEQKVAECVQAYEEHKDGDAERMMFEMLAMAAAHAMAEPTQDITWQTLADDCEAAGNWAGAFEARQKVLELAQSHSNPCYPVRPHLQLAGLYDMTGRAEEALTHIESALALARQSEISAFLLMALEAKIASELGKRDAAAIRVAAAEGLAAIGKERIFNGSKARFHIVIAGCAAELGDFTAAEQHLDAARQVMDDSKTGTLLPGRQWSHSRAAEVRARIHAGRGKIEQAIGACMENVERDRTLATGGARGRYRLAMTLRRFAGYLDAAGKTEEAKSVRTEFEQMLRELKL